MNVKIAGIPSYYEFKFVQQGHTFSKIYPQGGWEIQNSYFSKRKLKKKGQKKDMKRKG